MQTTNRIRIAAPALLALAMTLPAAAQVREAPGRYTMQPVDGGFMRLDTQTGAVSMCRPGAGGAVTCQPSQTDQGLPGEIARLRAENTELKAEVKRLEEIASLGGRPGPQFNSQPPEKLQLPTEQEVDQALDYVERMYKKFRDRLRNLEAAASPARRYSCSLPRSPYAFGYRRRGAATPVGILDRAPSSATEYADSSL